MEVQSWGECKTGDGRALETEETKAEHGRLLRREGRSGGLASGDRARQQVVGSSGGQVEDEQLLLWVCQRRLVLPPSHQYCSSLQSHVSAALIRNQSTANEKPVCAQASIWWLCCPAKALHLPHCLCPITALLLPCFCSNSRGKESHSDPNQASFLLLLCCCKLS